MRKIRTIVSIAAAGTLLCMSPDALAQRIAETVVGAWTISIRPPVPRQIVRADACQARSAQHQDGWIFTLIRTHGGLEATITNRHLRPSGDRGDVLPGRIGGRSVRFLVDHSWGAPLGPVWGLALTIPHEQEFRQGLEAGGELQISIPEGDLRWRADGGEQVLSAFERCNW